MTLNDKPNIRKWLNRYNVKNYTLVPDEQYGFVVNVDGDVNLYNKQISAIEIKFNIVSGYFYCPLNNLTSLEGCPTLVGGLFNCSRNELTSLEHCPESIGGGLDISNNKINNLYHLPKNISGSFLCHNNEGLGNFQKVVDFSEIKEIAASEKERNALYTSLANTQLEWKVSKL